MKIASSIVLIILVIIVIAAAAAVLPDATNPGIRAARAAEAQARADLRIAHAPYRAALMDAILTALAVLTLTTAASLAYALVNGAILRARLINPDRNTALYPAVCVDGQWHLLNETGAQTMAALPARPSAAVARALISTPRPAPQITAQPRPVHLDAPPDPAAALPTAVAIYDAPTPRHPALPVGIGPAAPIDLPLHQLGNVLIGGLPRHGKTELFASMMVGLLRGSANGASVSFGLIDTKRVDFGRVPDDLAALAWPVARETSDAFDLVDLVWSETEQRYQKLEAAGAKNLRQYRAQTHEPLPYLVLFIDEIADLAFDGRKSDRFFATVRRIGSKAPAAGVTIVMATQRPSADIIPSGLRGVCGTQIAFRTLNSIDSRTILGVGGAELLPAGIPGRCLVRRGEITPAQAYLASLDSGRFDQYIAARPRRSAPVPTVPAGNGNGNGHQTAYFSPSDQEQQEQERRWDPFLANALANGAPRSPTALARLMATHDGRPDDYPAYKSIAWRHLNPD